MGHFRTAVDATVRLDGLASRSETLVTEVGTTSVVVETTIPEPNIALTLTSTYLGCAGAPVMATHALARAGDDGRTWSGGFRDLVAGPTRARNACVLDHLAVLADALIDLGVSIELGPAAGTRARSRD